MHPCSISGGISGVRDRFSCRVVNTEQELETPIVIIVGNAMSNVDSFSGHRVPLNYSSKVYEQNKLFICRNFVQVSAQNRTKKVFDRCTSNLLWSMYTDE